MLISVGIVTYQSDIELLELTVNSLLDALTVAQDQYGTQAVLTFILNDTQPQHIENIDRFIRDITPRLKDGVQIKTIRGHGNIGYGGGQNKAISKNNSQYHVVLNPDVSFNSNVISDCIRFMEANADTAMTVPQGYDHTDQYAYLSKRPPTLLVIIVRGLSLRWLNRVFRSQLSRYTYRETLPSISPVPVTLASGCFMFCRTSVLNSIQGFNEKYFLYFEDFDLSMRIQKHGKIVELPDVRIRHFGGHAARNDYRRLTHFVSSAIRFFNSYGWWSHRDYSIPTSTAPDTILEHQQRTANGTK